MSRLTCFFAKVKPVILAVLMMCAHGEASAEMFPGNEIFRFHPKPNPAQEPGVQLHLMEKGAALREHLTLYAVNALLLMLLFGAFSTLWAQNTDRNELLWFLLGFCFTVFTVGYILWLNPRKRRKKRGNHG